MGQTGAGNNGNIGFYTLSKSPERIPDDYMHLIFLKFSLGIS